MGSINVNIDDIPLSIYKARVELCAMCGWVVSSSDA